MDAINKPAHYNQGPIECIDAMQQILTPEEYRGYLKGNVFKYLWREKDKNGNEDIRKGKSYYDRLIELIDESEQQKASGLQSLKDYPFGKLKTAPLNSDKIPEGYRKLKDSSIEPRQLGDLRWSISERRYIEIGFDEIGYANRDNWAACRRITEEVTGEVTGEVKPPDGWRFLQVGEVIRKGDKYRDLKSETWIECVVSVGDTLQDFHKPTIRRNKFEVGEKVVVVSTGEVFTLLPSLKEGMFGVDDRAMPCHYRPEELAPYIEETT